MTDNLLQQFNSAGLTNSRNAEVQLSVAVSEFNRPLAFVQNEKSQI